MRAPRSLRGRIVLAAVAALAVAGVLAGWLLVAAVARDGRDEVDRDLQRRAEGLTRGPMPAPRPSFEREMRPLPPGGPPDGPPPDAGLLEGSGTFVQLAAGGQVVQRGDVPADPPPVPGEDGFANVRIDGEEWRSLTASAGEARLQVLTTLEPVEARVADVREFVLAIGLGALLLTAIAAWAFTSVAVRPLARLREGAARVSGAEDLGTRLPDDDGPDEVRSLARDLNEMLARLDRAMKATRRFAADAGHEMRTPLTGMRANLDTLGRNPDLPLDERLALVRAMTAEQERVVHLLEGLQALARGDAAESLPREEVELADLVDAAAYAARRRHPEAVIDLEDRIADAAALGWPSGLRLLVDNLIDNAALHGRRGGHVRVALDRAGLDVVVRVDDDGPGIPEAERARLMEPFARGHGTLVPGTGLGLAIVAQQVALHGGSLSLGDSDLGGLAVEVRLPATGPPPPGPGVSSAEEPWPAPSQSPQSSSPPSR